MADIAILRRARPLYCELCLGDGEVAIGYGSYERREQCPDCDGFGTQGCNEPWCHEPATTIVTGGGAMCADHFLRFLKEQSVELERGFYLMPVDVQSSAKNARISDCIQFVRHIDGKHYTVTLHGAGDKAACNFTGEDLRELRRQLTDLLWENE